MTADYLLSLVDALTAELRLSDKQVVNYLSGPDGYLCLKIDLDKFSPSRPLREYSYQQDSSSREVWHFHLEPSMLHRRDDLHDLLTNLKPEIRERIKPLLFCAKLEGWL